MSFNQELVLLIISVLLGGIIGFLSSIGTLLIQRWIDTKGKVLIFYKKIFIDNDKYLKGGFYRDNGGNEIILSLPLVFELQNTCSNAKKVIRDLSLLMYSNGKLLNKMSQIETVNSIRNRGNEILKEEKIDFGAEKNSYSFILKPHSVQRQYCFFEYSINSRDIENYIFDEIHLRYYDERNKEVICDFMKIENCWEIQSFNVDTEWVKLKN